VTVPLPSPGKHRQRKRHVTYLDIFNENLLRRIIFDMSLCWGVCYGTKTMCKYKKEAAGIESSQDFMLRILKTVFLTLNLLAPTTVGARINP
jgi:hypothetical protein